jgi:hypothetical protein
MSHPSKLPPTEESGKPQPVCCLANEDCSGPLQRDHVGYGSIKEDIHALFEARDKSEPGSAQEAAACEAILEWIFDTSDNAAEGHDELDAALKVHDSIPKGTPEPKEAWGKVAEALYMKAWGFTCWRG